MSKAPATGRVVASVVAVSVKSRCDECRQQIE